jgi:membrane protein required for colicin V production
MMWIDLAIVLVLLISVLSAAKKGFFLEVFSLAGVVIGLVLAGWNYQKLLPWVTRVVHNWPAAEALSFLAIALGVMILAGLAGRVVRWAVHSIGLGWADRIIGAAFGFVKGCVLVTIAVLVIAAFSPKAVWFEHSRLAPYFLNAANRAAVATPNELGIRIRQGVEFIRSEQPEWLRPLAAEIPLVPAPKADL